jgi:hypothetical protein
MSSPDRNASISHLSLKNILPAKLAIHALRSMAEKARIVLGWNARAAVMPTTRMSEMAEAFVASRVGPIDTDPPFGFTSGRRSAGSAFKLRRLVRF